MGNTCCNTEEQIKPESNYSVVKLEGHNASLVDKVLEEQYNNELNSPDRKSVSHKNFNEIENNILDQQSPSKVKQPTSILVKSEYILEENQTTANSQAKTRQTKNNETVDQDQGQPIPSEENVEHYTTKLSAVKAHYEHDKEKLAKEYEKEKKDKAQVFLKKNTGVTWIQKNYRDHLNRTIEEKHGPSPSEGGVLKSIPTKFRIILSDYQLDLGMFLDKLAEQNRDDSKISQSFLLTNEEKESKNKDIGPVMLRNGNFYIGQWFNKKRNGKGLYIWSTGGIYEGEFVENKSHGVGRFAHNNKVYEGDWADDKMHGKLLF